MPQLLRNSLSEISDSGDNPCFAEYFDNPEISDLLLVTDTRTFHVHKQIIAMASPFFKAQLYSQHWSLEQAYVAPKVKGSKAPAKGGEQPG